jgi:hypothetical protein
MPITPRAHGLSNSELPSLFGVADKYARLNQYRYFLLLRVELISLALAATSSILSIVFEPAIASFLHIRVSSVRILGIIISGSDATRAAVNTVVPSTFVVLVVIVSTLRYILHLDDRWRQQRALAESIVGLAWRYVAHALPNELPYASQMGPVGEEAYFQTFQQFIEDSEGAVLPPASRSDFMITARMKELRDDNDLEQARVIYIQGRIKDMQNFYESRARRFRRQFVWLRFTFVFTLIIAVCVLPLGWLPIFTTCAAALTSWTEARQYEDLVQSNTTLYRRLAELAAQGNSVTLTGPNGQARWVRFVDQVETLFEGTNRVWLAHAYYTHSR